MGKKNYSITNIITGQFHNYMLVETDLSIWTKKESYKKEDIGSLYLERDHSRNSLYLTTNFTSFPIMNESLGAISFCKGGLTETHRRVKFIIPILSYNDLKSFMRNWNGRAYHLLAYDDDDNDFIGIVKTCDTKELYPIIFNPKFNYDTRCRGEFSYKELIRNADI